MEQMYKYHFSKILPAGSFLISWLGMLLWSLPVWGQTLKPDLTLLYHVEEAVSFLAADQLGQVYAVTPDNQLLKYGVDGEVNYLYQNFRHGDLGWVDASNPLHILIFYPEFGQVIILDRTLSELTQINLPELGLWDVAAVGRSGDNQLWLYDPVQMLIRKVSTNGSFLVEGQPLALILTEMPDPEWIREYKQEVYLYDPKLGVLVFDVFGQYLKTIPTEGMKNLRIGEKQWTYWKKGELFVYQPSLQSVHAIRVSLPASSGFIQGNRLILQTEKGFSVYMVN